MAKTAPFIWSVSDWSESRDRRGQACCVSYGGRAFVKRTDGVPAVFTHLRMTSSNTFKIQSEKKTQIVLFTLTKTFTDNLPFLRKIKCKIHSSATG